jgi:hypothetical protein
LRLHRFRRLRLQNTAPNHLAKIPKESTQPRPRAFEYFSFFASLTPSSAGDWKRVDLLEDANRGDILAWRFPTLEPHTDTGHVVILAETPKLASGDVFTVRIYDSALEAHFDDTREPNGAPSPTGATGVGSGNSQFQGRRRWTAACLSLRAAADGAIFLPQDRHRPRRLISVADS